MADSIKNTLRKSLRIKSKTKPRRQDDDSVLTQESDNDLDLEDNIESDTPSTSSIFQAETAPRLLQHLEEFDVPPPYNDDFAKTPSNTRATSPTTGDFTQMLNSREQEVTDEVITESSGLLKKVVDVYERGIKKGAQRVADTEDKGDQSKRPTLTEIRIESERNRDAKLDRELFNQNPETINREDESPQNRADETLREKVNSEEETGSEASEKHRQEE